MKKNYTYYFLLITIFVGISLNMAGQQETFTRVLYDNAGSISAFETVKSSDGNFIICGRKDDHPMILKIDPDGDVIWGKQYGDSYSRFETISATTDSCIIAAGIFPSHRILVLKSDETGDTLWTRILQSEVNDFDLVSVEYTQDNGVVILSSNYNYPESGITTMIMLDSSGAVQWANVISSASPDVDIHLRAIKPTNDSGFIASGIVNLPYPETDRFFVVKFQPDGSMSWSKSISDSILTYPEAFDIQALDDGYLFLGNEHIALIKSDLSGNFIWGRQTSFTMGNEAIFSNSKPKLNPTTDGGYIFRGFFGMMKTDAMGNEQWSQELFMYPVNVLETDDGGFMAIGNGPVLGVKMAETDNPQIGIIKTDALGNASGCIFPTGYEMSEVTYEFMDMTLNLTPAEVSSSGESLPVADFEITIDSGCVAFVGAVAEQQAQSMQISTYPNPSTGVFRIEVEADVANLFQSLEIYNVMGDIVYTTDDPAALENAIDLSLQPSGIYFIRGNFGNRKASGRVIIQR